MGNLSEDFGDLVRRLVQTQTGDHHLRPDNVLQEGNTEGRQVIDQILDSLLLPGSGISGKTHLRNLFDLSSKGFATLILMEHYSNFDYPCFYKFVAEQTPLDAERLLPIAGKKLTEDDPNVAAFANAYNKLVICPTKNLEKMDDPSEIRRIKHKIQPINFASMKHLLRLKNKGRVVVAFPAGTRYRPWDPDSKKAVGETQSYLRVFDYICFASVNGNLLLPCRNGDMTADLTNRDTMIFSISPPIRSQEFLSRLHQEAPQGGDFRSFVGERVMNELDQLHRKYEARS